MTSAADLNAVFERAHITVHRDGAVATVTLSRPDARNAQTVDTWAALAQVPVLLTADTRVVIIRGVGKSFSAGLDRQALTDGTLTRIAELPADAADARIAEFQSAFSWLADSSFVSIAGVQGHAIGAGFQLALACDLIVAADDAEFSMFEVALGLVPDLGGTLPLIRAVGRRRALELCLTGRRIDAAEALRIGLVLDVVAPGELSATVRRLAASILAHPAAAVRAVTELIGGAATSADEQRARERAAQLPLLRALAKRTRHG